jgi:hypothetical protein
MGLSELISSLAKITAFVITIFKVKPLALLEQIYYDYFIVSAIFKGFRLSHTVKKKKIFSIYTGRSGNMWGLAIDFFGWAIRFQIHKP